jgi:hypothetical protein
MLIRDYSLAIVWKVRLKLCQQSPWSLGTPSVWVTLFEAEAGSILPQASPNNNLTYYLYKSQN